MHWPKIACIDACLHLIDAFGTPSGARRLRSPELAGIGLVWQPLSKELGAKSHKMILTIT